MIKLKFHATSHKAIFIILAQSALTAPCILSCRLFPVGINKNYKTVVRMQLDPQQVNKPIQKAGRTLGHRTVQINIDPGSSWGFISLKKYATCYSCSRVEIFWLVRMRG